MALENRNGNLYYYRKRREGNRVISEYVGGGEVGLLIARYEIIEQAKAEKEKEARKAARFECEAADRKLDDLEKQLNKFLETYLLAKVFIRLQAVNGDINKMVKKKKDELANIQTDFNNLIKRLNSDKPDESDTKFWKEFVKNNPDAYFRLNGLTASIQNDIVERSNNFIYEEKLKDELKQMRDNLGYSEATELERLLIEQFCLNWLRLGVVERLHSGNTYEKHSVETGLYWERRLDTANRRFNRTAETLAKVKRLLADANLKKAQETIKILRSKEMERKFLPLSGNEKRIH